MKQILNLKIKAFDKYEKEKVILKPVFFSWHIGIQYKYLTGYNSASFFCSKRESFDFPIETKIIMGLVKVWYFLKYYLYRKLRYQIPYKIKSKFKKKTLGDLPF